jgi:hypothetical protein
MAITLTGSLEWLLLIGMAITKILKGGSWKGTDYPLFCIEVLLVNFFTTPCDFYEPWIVGALIWFHGL